MILNSMTKKSSLMRAPFKTSLSILALCVATTSFAIASSHHSDDAPLLGDDHSAGVARSHSPAPSEASLSHDGGTPDGSRPYTANTSFEAQRDRGASELLQGNEGNVRQALFRSPLGEAAPAATPSAMMLSPAASSNTRALREMGIGTGTPVHFSYYREEDSLMLDDTISKLNAACEQQKKTLLKEYSEAGFGQQDVLNLMNTLFKDTATLEEIEDVKSILGGNLRRQQKPAQDGAQKVSDFLGSLAQKHVALLKDFLEIKIELANALNTAKINAATIQGLLAEREQLAIERDELKKLTYTPAYLRPGATSSPILRLTPAAEASLSHGADEANPGSAQTPRRELSEPASPQAAEIDSINGAARGHGTQGYGTVFQDRAEENTDTPPSETSWKVKVATHAVTAIAFGATGFFAGHFIR